MLLVMRTITASVLLLAAAITLYVWHTMLGLDGGFYARMWWWDIPSHMLGGFIAALFSVWTLRSATEHIPKGWRVKLRTIPLLKTLLDLRFSIAVCISIAFIVGVGWEVFESWHHIGGSPFMGYWTDTIKDLFDDILGGALAGYLARALM